MPGNILYYYVEWMGDETNYFITSPSVIPNQIDLETELSQNSSSSEQEYNVAIHTGKAEVRHSLILQILLNSKYC